MAVSTKSRCHLRSSDEKQCHWILLLKLRWLDYSNLQVNQTVSEKAFSFLFGRTKIDTTGSASLNLK